VAEKVGDIYYDVTVETGRMIDAQREIERRARETASSLGAMGGGAKTAESGFRSAGAAAQEASGRFRDAAGKLREANGQFVKAGGSAAGAAGGIGQAASASDILTGKLSQVSIAVKIFAAAMALVKSAQMADDMRLLAARVEVAAGSMQLGADAMRALQDISTRTQTSMEGNVEVFARLNQSMIQMGGTQADTLQLTELLGKAIKVSGASAVEAKAAMLQFGQALGSGKLAGDELRSLMETAPYLMRQLADGIGVPVGALKKMGEEGKLTSDVVVNALGKAAKQIDQDFQKFPQTIDAAMTVAGDAAKRAAEKFDDMTGTSAILAGATKGLGTVLDKLAEQFGAGTTEADKLGRSTLVKTWAEDTAVVLTYVVDAADFVVRGFKQMGTALGGLAAAAGAAATGELTQAKNILGMMADDIKSIGNAKFSGAKMREQFQFAKEFVGPQAPADLGYTASKLKAPKQEGDKKKGKKPFDSGKYIAGLAAKAATDEWKRVAEIEQEALRQNDEHLKKKDISAAQHEKAKTLILAAGTQARQELAQEELDKLVQNINTEERLRDEAAARQRQKAEQQSRAEMEARQLIADAQGDPVERIRLEEEAKLAAQQAAYDQQLISLELFEQAKAAIRAKAAADEQAIQEANNVMSVQLMGKMTDDVLGILQKSGKERTALGKALFLATKALAVAEILINTEVAAAKAGAQLGIFGVPMATLIRAQGYASAGMVAGMAVADVAGGRAYGGPVSADRLYRVNERGAPEMFTASNGRQYMLPTTGGQVTAADKVGGGAVQVSIQVINNHSGAQVTTRTDDTGRTTQIVISEIVNQISSNSGPVWSALRGATNVRSAL